MKEWNNYTKLIWQRYETSKIFKHTKVCRFSIRSSFFVFLFFFFFFKLQGIVHFYGHHGSSVALIWFFNARGVHNFITKIANISVNFALFHNVVWFLLSYFLKSGVKSFVLKSKKVRFIYSKQDKTLLLVTCYFCQHI